MRGRALAVWRRIFLTEAAAREPAGTTPRDPPEAGNTPSFRPRRRPSGTGCCCYRYRCCCCCSRRRRWEIPLRSMPAAKRATTVSRDRLRRTRPRDWHSPAPPDRSPTRCPWQSRRGAGGGGAAAARLPPETRERGSAEQRLVFCAGVGVALVPVVHGDPSAPPIPLPFPLLEGIPRDKSAGEACCCSGWPSSRHSSLLRFLRGEPSPLQLHS
mmetsp:Transcript_15063/g.41896  ORF Transcript_15063/g.41896 Transcript_15063/m.41896 type:complete len:213 (+) Transcript_15063:179-817(+)